MKYFMKSSKSRVKNADSKTFLGSLEKDDKVKRVENFHIVDHGRHASNMPIVDNMVCEFQLCCMQASQIDISIVKNFKGEFVERSRFGVRIVAGYGCPVQL